MVVVAAADASISGASSCKQIMMMRVGGGGSGCPSKFISMELRWISGRRKLKPNSKSMEFGSFKSKSSPLMMPIYITTDPSHINLQQLVQLYSSCNHSCQRFPEVDPQTGLVKEAMDMGKLRLALSHSCAIVSVFCKPQHIQIQKQEKCFVEYLMESVMPVTPTNGQLVGFGRAVSDLGLTASIYDVMVIPSLQGMGIGTMIVKRIVRILTSRDIYDIAALCSRKERFFFKTCGFRDDILGSTTMMYTRTVSSCSCFEGDQIVKRAGRKLLLLPPLTETFTTSTRSKPQS